MDYISWIRSYIGNQEIILNFSGVIVTNQKNEILLNAIHIKKKNNN